VLLEQPGGIPREDVRLVRILGMFLVMMSMPPDRASCDAEWAFGDPVGVRVGGAACEVTRGMR